ncbi:PLP-dependent aminotransferase family protein [Gordonia sihwensis]|uniref:aminotransferase-like domain-containing protein n=1 Tax=Gordonia sihwensis TaxID=173559 RepID=UPI003D963A64
MARTPRDVHLPISLPTPVRSRRLVDELLAAIVDGRLAEGDWLPSTRVLARQLSCSRSVVTGCYDELIAAGFLDGIPGAGTRVRAGARAAVRLGARSHVTEESAPVVVRGEGAVPRIIGDLRPGVPDGSLIDARRWRSCVRAATWTPEPPTAGTTALTAALGDHLRRHRGVHVEQILLTPGSSCGFALLGEAAWESGIRRAFVEAPGYAEAQRELARAGFSVEPVEVDADGVCVGRLPDDRCLVYTTPAHQYPLGHRMSVDRRARLVEWARRTGSVIIEDDYDGEFRYDVPPLPALQALPGAREFVGYVGTASKTLTVGLAVAWTVPPGVLSDAVGRRYAERAWSVAEPVAGTLAEFISRGHLATHLAKVARTYRDRRNALSAAVIERCPEMPIIGVDAGLHATIVIDRVPGAQVRDRLERSGWLVRAVSDYPLADKQSVDGVVVSYARLTPASAVRFAEALRRAVPEVLSEGGGRVRT